MIFVGYLGVSSVSSVSSTFLGEANLALFVDANLQDMRFVKLMDVAKYANIQGATHVRNPNNETLRSIFTSYSHIMYRFKSL